MADGITDDGDYLVPDSRCCYFHRHIGEEAVRAVADAAIAKYQPDVKTARMTATAIPPKSVNDLAPTFVHWTRLKSIQH